MKLRTILLYSLIIGNSFLLKAQQLSLQWAQRAGDIGWDYASSISRSNNGFFIGGSYKGVILGDTTQNKTLNSNNAWLSHYDTLGNLIWQKTFGGKDYDNITSLAATSQGLLVAGIFQDTLLFDLQVLASDASSSAFLGMVNSLGEPVWLRKIGEKATINSLYTTANDSDISFIAGVFKDSLTLSGALKAVYGEKGIFLNRIQSNGNDGNMQVLKCSGMISIAGLGSNDSLICIAGSYQDTLRVADTQIVSNDEADVFVALFDLNGNLRWIQTAGGIGNDHAYSVVLTNGGEIGITGYFEHSAYFGNQVIQSKGGKDIFTVIFNNDGSVKWIKSIGDISDDYGFAIATNGQNDFFVSGSYIHTIQLPDETGDLIELSSFSEFGNSFIAKYNDVGVLKASFNQPGTSEDYSRSLVVDSDGNITTTGSFYGTLQLQDNNSQPIELVSIGEKDIFVLQFKDMCKDFNLEAGTDTSFCPGQTIYLSSPGNYYSYQWFPGGLKNHDLEVNQIGSYQVVVTNEFGCIAIDSLDVSLAPVPLVYAGNDTIIEAGEPLVLGSAQSDGSDGIHWETNGDGYFYDPYSLNTSYSMSYSDISAGSVLLKLTGYNNCSSVQSSFTLSLQQEDDGITVYPNPTPGNVTLVCEENLTIQSVTISTQGANYIQFNIPVNNYYYEFDLSPYPPGTYLFHLTTNEGIITKLINKL